MKLSLIQLSFLIIGIIFIHSIRVDRSGFVIGNINENSSSEWIIAVDGTDSVRMPYKGGYFYMKLKPGMWKMFVAKQQSSYMVRENLWVREGENIDLGEIRLAD